MWLKKIDYSAKSDAYDLGFLYQSGKVYIMDNHLAAGWCWLNALDTNKSYHLFHIDRHFDLLNNESAEYLLTLSLDKKPTLEAYLRMRVSQAAPSGRWELFRYDNYIMNIHDALPGFFAKKIFATHWDGSIPRGFKIDYNPTVYGLPTDLAYQIECHNDRKWILNLDLDYFFANKDSTAYLRILSDEYIDQLCEQIIQVMGQIDVVTIAMSPYFCNGWENSKKVLERVTLNLGIKIDFPDSYFPR